LDDEQVLGKKKDMNLGGLLVLPFYQGYQPSYLSLY
jgi:hypothetical protein